MFSKKSWSPYEDAVLKHIIHSQGRINWNTIASYLPERTGKQCRERWHNHLEFGIIKGNWTKEEDMTIMSEHAKVGNRWSQIAKLLLGRPENDIKNRFYTLNKANNHDKLRVSCLRETNENFAFSSNSFEPTEEVVYSKIRYSYNSESSSCLDRASFQCDYSCSSPESSVFVRSDVPVSEEVTSFDIAPHYATIDQDVLDYLVSMS